MKLPILHIDDDIVAIDKPVAIPTHAPQDDPYPGDVVSALRAQLGVDYLGVHQRLDADTSGVLLFTLRESANASLAASFAGRAANKHYVALVHGVPATTSGVIDRPIAPTTGGRRAIAEPGDRLAQHAITRHTLRATSVDGQRALVDLHPETGRTHQLRVHLDSIGCPIVGDRLYDEEHFFPRLMLHAHALELPHPVSGAPLRITSPLPFGFVEALEWREPLPLEAALRLALERRRPLALDATTTAWRLLNGEGDGLAGATIDHLDGEHVVDVTDAALRERIVVALARATQHERATQHDREVTPDPHRADEPRARHILIDGLPFLTALLGGRIRPSLEYRETIARVRHWCRERRVLACGVVPSGLALAALSVADDMLVVERARPLLEWHGRAVEHAGLAGRPSGALRGELHEQLERLARRARTFDVVIVDIRAVLARAPRGAWSLERVALSAVELVAEQGLAVLCLDDKRVTRRAYRRRVASALESAGLRSELVAAYGQSPIDMPTVGESPLGVLLVRRLSADRSP